jgi:hypothetical protein
MPRVSSLSLKRCRVLLRSHKFGLVQDDSIAAPENEYELEDFEVPPEQIRSQMKGNFATPHTNTHIVTDPYQAVVKRRGEPADRTRQERQVLFPAA